MSDAPAAPFSRHALGWVIGIIAVSLLTGIILVLFAPELQKRPSHRTDSLSASAIGHAAFRELLEELDIPVVISRNPATRRAARNGLLIVAEPYEYAGLEGRLAAAKAALLVLPKWDGPPHPAREDWVESGRLLERAPVNLVLNSVAEKCWVDRVPHGGTNWTGDFGAPALRPAQLMHGRGLAPVIACAEGIFLAEVTLPGTTPNTTWICSDPDVLATHGLGRGGNAPLIVAVVNALRDGGPVVFDETLHGMSSEPSIWRELFEYPLVLATVQALLGAALLVWIAMVRFGAPLPPEPPYAAGKRFLIENTAALQQRGGHTGYVLHRYLRATLRAVAEALHVPPGLPASELKERLQRLARARGVTIDLDRLDADVADQNRPAERREARGRALTAMAKRIYRWRQEMLRGS